MTCADCNCVDVKVRLPQQEMYNENISTHDFSKLWSSFLMLKSGLVIKHFAFAELFRYCNTTGKKEKKGRIRNMKAIHYVTFMYLITVSSPGIIVVFVDVCRITGDKQESIEIQSWITCDPSVRVIRTYCIVLWVEARYRYTKRRILGS